MKSFAPVALLGAALVTAAPLDEKREVVWHTTFTEVTETAWTTTTKWVAPGSEVSAAAFVNPGGDFHETAVHFSPKKPEFTPQGPPEFSFPAYQQPSEAPVPEPTPSTQAPPPPPPPAPTTPSSTYVAPAPTPESPYVAPAPPSSQAPPPPPPPPPTTKSVYVAPTPSTTSTYVAPTPTSVYTPPPAPAAPSPVAAAPQPQAEGSGSSSSSGSSSGGGATYTDAKLTFYSTGLGSCGITSNDSEMVVAVELGIMQKTDNGNPNNNPMCGKKISITANGKTRTATIVDSCPGCQGDAGLDLSPALFKEFAPESVGVITGASWKVLG